MSEAEAASMVSVVASLSKSFDQVPPSAVPAVLDCILLSTGLSPPSLFTSLLNDFPRFLKDIIGEDGSLDSDKQHRLVSLVGAFCHLLKKTGGNCDAIQLFLWRCFLPLAKELQPSQHDLLNLITESLMDVVIETGTLEVLEETLLPVFIRSVGLSMEMIHNDDLSLYEWSGESCQGSHDVMDKEQFMSSSNCFKLTTSCNVLSVLVLGREKEGIPVDIIHILDACVEIPQFGVVRSLNVHVSGAIALWEYTRQQRSK
ncbi:tRNA/rRNA methyltransferase (SpoU) family protein [Trifolium repens]|nr:tRNA/rRNA methyltransferase (SpoU) family protein [Trifolium repens]